MNDLVNLLQPITLEEMDGVKLMNRIDTKYVTTQTRLEDILRDAAAHGYRILVVDGSPVSSYDSVYFDTAGLKMFADHHNRRLVRQKVRTRAYLNSGDAFLDIKRKNNKGRTKKKRCPIPMGELPDFRSDATAAAYLAGHSAFTAEQLSPVLETIFRRMTLVNREMTERLTIDSRLSFKNRRTGSEASLGPAVIIELKQDGHASSEMKDILLEHRVKPLRVSKYCIGVTITDPSAKHNRFKRNVRSIEKITNKKIASL